MPTADQSWYHLMLMIIAIEVGLINTNQHQRLEYLLLSKLFFNLSVLGAMFTE